MLPPSALLRPHSRPEASPPTRPAAGRLPAAAGHRAAGVDLDAGSIGGNGSYSVCVLYQESRCIAILSIGTYAIGDTLLYVKKASYSYTAIGDFETFDDSRLSAKFCVLPVRRSVQGLRCPQSLRPGPSVRCEGKEKAVSGGRFVGNKAAKTTLLGLLCSSMSAEPPPKSRDKGIEVCETESAKAASDSHPFIPQPQGD